MKENMISVIIPVYNAEKTISRTLDSFLNQNYDQYEIICINDGSTDNTVEIINKYIIKHKNISLISKNNEGPSSARNLGLKKSKGQYVMFADADDTVSNDCLKVMSNYMNKYDVIISGFSRIINGKKIDYIPESNKKLSLEDFLVQNYMFWSPCFKLINKSCIKFEFDESLIISEDLKFWVNNAKFFKNYKYLKISTYNYFMNDSSSTTSKNYDLKEEKSLDAMAMLTNESTSGLYIKQYFLDNYFEYKYRILNDKNSDKYNLYQKKYKLIAKKFYQDILKSKIGIKIKIKNFIKYRMFILYKFIKNHK